MSKMRVAGPDVAKTPEHDHSSKADGADGKEPGSRSTSRGEPSFTAESLARSVFGRAYWGQRQHDDLLQLNAQSEGRIAAQRKEWKARHKQRMTLIAKEQERKARIARSGRRDQGAE